MFSIFSLSMFKLIVTMLRPYVRDGRLDLDGIEKIINHRRMANVGVTKLNNALPTGKNHRKVYAKILHVKKYDGANVTFTRGRGATKTAYNKAVDASYNRMIICW
jgi:hypothetical protein